MSSHLAPCCIQLAPGVSACHHRTVRVLSRRHPPSLSSPSPVVLADSYFSSRSRRHLTLALPRLAHDPETRVSQHRPCTHLQKSPACSKSIFHDQRTSSPAPILTFCPSQSCAYPVYPPLLVGCIAGEISDPRACI